MVYKTQSVVKQIIIVTTIAVIIVMTCEIALRIGYANEKTSRPISAQDIAYEYDKEYIVKIKPNVKKMYRRSKVNGGNEIEWKSNSEGYRGEELSSSPDLKIIVYGDSNVQARFTRLENTFPYRLQKNIAEKLNKKVEVVNAGVVGYGPDQYLKRFEREADNYDPDIAIFVIFADNDFGDLIRNRMFELDSKGNLITTNYRRQEEEELKSAIGAKRYIKSLFIVNEVRKITKKLRAKERNKIDLFESFKLLCEKEYQIYKKRLPRKVSNFKDHYDIDLAIDPTSESSKTKIALMEKILVKAKTIATKKNVEFLVLILPSAIDITKNVGYGNKRLSYETLKKNARYKKRNLSNAVKKICISNEIRYINLYDEFIREKPEVMYLMNEYGHWSDEGQRIAALEVSKHLNKEAMENRIARK